MYIYICIYVFIYIYRYNHIYMSVYLSSNTRLISKKAVHALPVQPLVTNIFFQSKINQYIYTHGCVHTLVCVYICVCEQIKYHNKIRILIQQNV